MARSRFVVLSAAVLLVLVTPVFGGEALDRIERILMVAQAFDHGMPAEADLTEEVNALLAMPVEEVVGAIREALELGGRFESITGAFLPLIADLGRFLTETSRPRRDRDDPLLFAVNGCVLLPADPHRIGAGPLHQVPELSTVTGENPKLRAPLKPDPGGLLTLLLAEPERFDLTDSVLRDSLSAAVSVESLAYRVRGAIGKVDPASPVAGILAHAHPRPMSFVSKAALYDLLVRAAGRAPSTVSEVARAARNAGRPGIVEHVRTMLSAEKDEGFMADFDRAVGPWFALRRSLVERSEPPNAAELVSLTVALRECEPLRSFPEFTEFLIRVPPGDTQPPEVTAAAREALSALVWPRWAGRAEIAMATDRHPPRGYSIRALGGHVESGRRVARLCVRSIERGLRWAPRPFAPVLRDPLSAPRDYVLANDPPSGVRVSARLRPTVVRIRIENTGDAPLWVNPLAFEFAAVRTLRITDFDGPELRLILGVLGRGLEPEIDFTGEILASIPAGGARTMTIGLPRPVIPGERVFVEMFDPTVMMPGFGIPEGSRRLKSFTGVRAIVDETPLTEVDRKARALLDRIVFFDHPGEEPIDLTAKSNELLALGRGAVARAFRDALDTGCTPGTPAADRRYVVLSLASALMAVPPWRTNTPWESGEGFRSVEGAVIFVEDAGGFYTGPPERYAYPPGLPDLGGRFPDRLRPSADAPSGLSGPRSRSREAPADFLRALDRALAKGKPEAVQAVLWPGFQYPVESGRNIGGWPDPVAGGRWLREQIRSGVVRLRRYPPRPSLYTATPRGRIDGRPVGECVELRGARDGDVLRFEVTNLATGPICVNPLAFRFATAQVVTRTETRAVKIFLGRGLYRMRSVISPERLITLKPDETRKFAFALEKGLPANTKLTVGFSDPFLLDSPPPHPRLERTRTVDVK